MGKVGVVTGGSRGPWRHHLRNLECQHGPLPEAQQQPLRRLGHKRVAACMPLVFDPGERWEYGINTDRAGKTVEMASGQSLDVYLREHIFAPLGMAEGVPDGFGRVSSVEAVDVRLIPFCAAWASPHHPTSSPSRGEEELEPREVSSTRSPFSP
ncbi:MAG: serine hydrolase [Dehalococcoidia bacterium]